MEYDPATNYAKHSIACEDQLEDDGATCICDDDEPVEIDEII